MRDEERNASVVHAFRLTHDIQAGLPGAAGALSALRRRGEEHEWDDLERACLFGEAVRCWIAGDGDPSRPVGELIEQATRAGDGAMLALGLALRSDVGFSGEVAARTPAGDEDLAQAVVLLEHETGRPCEQISAHTACGIALGNRWLFELSHEQYEQALAIGRVAEPGSLDFLLAPIQFNLAEEQVSWASKLYEIGDEVGIRHRWRSWNDLVAATEEYRMCQGWQVELAALGLVLSAMSGNEVADEATGLLRRLDPDPAGEPRAAGLLKLAVALELAASGDAGAGEAVEAALASISPTVHPFMSDLALFVAAGVEAGAGSSSGLRYARRVVEEQWARRNAALAAMGAHIDAVRLKRERDTLSRHARLDDLTGIANRRALEEYLDDLVRRGVERCALVIFDVDSFKSVNDRHGHLTGDRVLVRIAETLSHGVRSSDLAVRFGGDEFAVVLAGASAADARLRAEQLVSDLHGERIGEIVEDVHLRVSAGLAVGRPGAITDIWSAADAALYAAKAAGGNRVTVAGVADPVRRPSPLG